MTAARDGGALVTLHQPRCALDPAVNCDGPAEREAEGRAPAAFASVRDQVAQSMRGRLGAALGITRHDERNGPTMDVYFKREVP